MFGVPSKREGRNEDKGKEALLTVKKKRNLEAAPLEDIDTYSDRFAESVAQAQEESVITYGKPGGVRVIGKFIGSKIELTDQDYLDFFNGTYPQPLNRIRERVLEIHSENTQKSRRYK